MHHTLFSLHKYITHSFLFINASHTLFSTYMYHTEFFLHSCHTIFSLPTCHSHYLFSTNIYYTPFSLLTSHAHTFSTYMHISHTPFTYHTRFQIRPIHRHSLQVRHTQSFEVYSEGCCLHTNAGQHHILCV